ncbi:MAG: S-methyl-5-thioribose-1-phosphate isomerase [Gemmataceae bacterium]|nr:S-methyl-5-thioribose-1-phosphate isomerase [Gemmataceae bacterium]
MKAIEWIGDGSGFLRLLDQTRLPGEVAYRDCREVPDVVAAIRELAVRGAPAIGVAAAYGVVVGAGQGADWQDLGRKAAVALRQSRPTAVNLMWACDRMLRLLDSPDATRDRLLREADLIRAENAEMCRAISLHGAPLMPMSGGVLTHCNTGPLATADFGTALGVIAASWESGARFTVFVDETRPLLQGARLTVWELAQAGIDHSLICDNMAGLLMQQGKVQAVVVGADRIARNGDTANKIGTYSVAVLARYHGIPFYVAAPSTTFDMGIGAGTDIPIEERDPREITHGFGRSTAPAGVRAYNPAFDVTPAGLITAIVTERGVIDPVKEDKIRAVLGGD